MATLLLLLFSYFLYDDSLLFPQRDESGLRRIGRINVSGNDVRVKSATAFTWFPAQQVDVVHLNDAIFTGERSKAQVRLEDGSLLEVSENSLITLNTRDGQMNLELRYGDLDTKLSPNKPLKIQADGKTYELSGSGTVRINKSGNGIDVSVTEGSAKVKGQKGEQNVAAGRRLKVSADGAIETAATPVITTPPEKSVVTQVFRTIDAGEKRTASTALSWTTDPLYEKYQYEISRDPVFLERVHLAETRQAGVETPALGNGVYSYRVRGVYKDGRKSPWSGIAEYRIELTPELIPPPEAPVMSRKQYEFNAGEQRKRAPSSVPKPVVSWSKVDRAKSYRVQFSRRPDFENAQSYSVEGQSLAWPDSKPGTWHVRVAAVSEEGLNSAPSEASKLQVNLDELRLDPMNKLSVSGPLPFEQAPPGEVKARWTPVPGASSYLVQLDGSSDFAAPQQFSLPAESDSAALPLPRPGQYHVRVRALGEDGRPVTAFSNSEMAEYEYVHEKSAPPPAALRAPALVEPFDQAAIFLQSTRQPMIWLEWRKVLNVSRYEIEVALEPEFKRPLLTERLENNRYLLRRQIPVGKFYWRVRAYSEDGVKASEWTDARQFTIYSQKNEAYIP
ncbi:MAG: FecR domain-containing protein [Bdellovibrionaceae bacterium]|nr:FecR domain-containing protein [Pseudobdellovibrionaceae bacterium]MBX3033336.1 FecR domain-containing protein [Pseudobdellovibrionaceae bacterium]